MRVKALRDIYYNHRNIKAGEEFEPLEHMHGVALVAAQSVEEVKPEMANVEPQPEATVSNAEDRRNNYRRRDMRARK